MNPLRPQAYERAARQRGQHVGLGEAGDAQARLAHLLLFSIGPGADMRQIHG